MNDDDLDPHIHGRRGSEPGISAGTTGAERAEDAPPGRPWRVTLELPAVAPPEAEAHADAPPRRVTLELPVVCPVPAAEQILRILRSPQEPGETVEGAFCRRERELGAVFEAFDPAEASELFRRLASPRMDDPVAMGFARLTPERRGRLLVCLVSPPARDRRRPSRPQLADD